MKSIVIYGAGGFGRETLQIIRDLNRLNPTWEFLGFLSDDETQWGAPVHEFKILGGRSWLEQHPETHCVVAVGNPWTKAKIVESLGKAKFATLVHPTAQIGHGCEVGEGSIICGGTILTVDITFGRHVILNIGCMVGHDTVVGDFCTINPTTNLSGNVTVGQGVLIGTQCSVIPQAEIGEWTIIGASAAVTSSLPANCTAVGVPAKAIKQRDAGWHLGG